MDNQRSHLTELREQIRLARAEKGQLAEKLADTSIDSIQKQQSIRRYNIIVGNLKGMVSDLEHAIEATKRVIESNKQDG